MFKVGDKVRVNPQYKFLSFFHNMIGIIVGSVDILFAEVKFKDRTHTDLIPIGALLLKNDTPESVIKENTNLWNKLDEK